MKYGILLVIALTVTSTSAQSIDSIAIKQVDSLIQISRTLTEKQDFDKALEVNATAEELALKKFGPESTAYESCCFSHGRISHVKGDFVEAEKWFIEGKAITEKTSGKDHPNYAIGLNMLADLYFDMGQYKKAEPFYLEVKGIREKTLGKDHPDYAFSLNMLAVTYWAMGQYDMVEPLFLEAKATRECVLGKDHPDYAESLNNLAMLYQAIGQYEKALPLNLEAKAIREKTLGKEHRNFVMSLNNLALLYQNMGQYEKAEPLYLESKSILGKSLPTENSFYATVLMNLGVLYSLMGQYEMVEQFYLEGKTIREKILGREHPDFARILINMSTNYVAMGQYDKAETLFLEAKAIVEKVLGREHSLYSQALNNLGCLYGALGNNEKAETLYLESLTIKEKTLGRNHPDYAQNLHNLANLYTGKGQYEKAEPLYLETTTIREKALGKEHPDYAQSLHLLANLYEKQNRFIESEPLLEEYFGLTKSRLSKSTAFLSAGELANYAATFQASGDNLSSYLLTRIDGGKTSGRLPTLLYDQTLFQKGFLLAAASCLNNLASSSPEAEELNNQLKGCRRRLASEISKPIVERNGVEELEEKANELEKELSRTVAGYGVALQQVKWQTIQAKLDHKALAIEFVHFQVNFPRSSDSIQYAALLLMPGKEQPIFIPLFEEKELDHFLSAGKERKADYVNEIYTWADRGLVKLGSEKKSLYALIWEKIQAEIPEGTRTIYYSPSGVLHRLNLGAIAFDEETILSDKFNLVALNSTRQLVTPSAFTTQIDNAFLVGGVNFDVDTFQSTLDEIPLISIRSYSGSWSDAGTRDVSWPYLKWTEKEVERIASTLNSGGFKAAQLTGAAATEEAIKMIGLKAASPRILHMATHGFFFPDPESNLVENGLDDEEPVFKSSDNPMIRSGLILAGGNYAWQNGHALRPDIEDGILTAFEISQMNLSNTELVVLSACETGLGDIQGNEGVYGLQRAFKIAGAKYLIMSLWQVPDRETMEFMTTFYKNWLEQKLSIPDAFRKTQREMRDRFFNPYQWAGFVLVE